MGKCPRSGSLRDVFPSRCDAQAHIRVPRARRPRFSLLRRSLLLLVCVGAGNSVIVFTRGFLIRLMGSMAKPVHRPGYCKADPTYSAWVVLRPRVKAAPSWRGCGQGGNSSARTESASLQRAETTTTPPGPSQGRTVHSHHLPAVKATFGIFGSVNRFLTRASGAASSGRRRSEADALPPPCATFFEAFKRYEKHWSWSMDREMRLDCLHAETTMPGPSCS